MANGDPLWEYVTLLTSFDGNFLDKSRYNRPLVETTGGYTTAGAKFTGSFNATNTAASLSFRPAMVKCAAPDAVHKFNVR